MLKLLQISDLHCGPPFLPRVGEAVLRIAPQLAPDAIVISGDFTQRAKPEQFAQARAFLDQLPEVPKVVVPGNHDVPLYRLRERLLNPHGHYRRYICESLDNTWELDGAVIVGLDSTAPRRTITNGRISPQQLEYCERAFAKADNGQAKIVVAHHHFAPAPDYQRDQVMPNTKRTMQRLFDMGVDLILGGHLHRGYIGDSLDIYPHRPGHQGIIIVQCGTTTSRRGRAREKERNSLNTIHIGPEMIRVSHYMYFDDTETFEPTSRHMFPRRGRRLQDGE